MARTAINLYSVRDLDLPMAEILDRVAAAGYDGVQFSGDYGELSPDEIADELDDLDLAATAAHVDIEAMEDDPDGVVDTCETIGADGAVVPWLGPEHFESHEAAAAAAERVDAVLEDLAAHGTPLHYHNHDHEFVGVDGATGFETFVEESHVLLEPDVGWIETAGHDPAAFIDDHADRIEIVHMKDMDGGDFAEIGEGDVDMTACAEAARRADAEWLVYEHDQPEDPAASIQAGADFLADL